MFERFTERARQVIVLAQEEARDLKHSYIGTEHVLLGLMREEDGVAARVLDQYLSADQVRNAIVRIVGEGERSVVGQIPFTPRGKKILEGALREALSLGHNYIGTEHILLALARDPDGVAARILLDHGIQRDNDIRSDVIKIMTAPKSEKKSSTQHKTEAENLKDSGQKDSEQSREKAQVTITYGDLTLKLEGDISGLANTLTNQTFEYLKAISKKL